MQVLMGEERHLLNKEQLAELRQAFNECDRNSDNFITTKELGWAMRVMGHNPTEAELLQLVNKESGDSLGGVGVGDGDVGWLVLSLSIPSTTLTARGKLSSLSFAS